MKLKSLQLIGMNEEIASGDINRACHYIARRVGEGVSLDMICKQLALQYFEFFMSSDVFLTYGVYPIQFFLCRVLRLKKGSSIRIYRSMLIELTAFACHYYKNCNELDKKHCYDKNAGATSESELEQIIKNEYSYNS